MDATTKAVIETISDAGYGVLYGADPAGRLIVEAINRGCNLPGTSDLNTANNKPQRP